MYNSRLHFVFSLFILTIVKKAKKPKSKGQKLQLSDFLGTVPSVSQVNITKNISWGDECEQEDIVSIALPTAPRSTRVLDDALIPQEPPFLAYMTNLPYDLNEEDLQQYFEEQLECEVVSVRLPRDDKDSGRMRGFGYVEFKEREDLIAAVSLPDPQIRNRRIRIDISNENDQKRGNSRRGYDNFGSSSENRDTNWRRDDGARGQEDDRESGRRGGYNYGNRDRERQRDQGADPDNSNWRSGDRPKPESPPPSRRNFQDRGEGGAGGERYGRDRFGGRRNNGYEERPRRDEPVLEEERPRLQLKPRTLPLPELEMKPDDDVKPREPLADEQQSQPRPKPVPVPAASIFGSAKPVDTAAKDRLIEERMERERQEKIKAEEQEREEKEKESEEKENDASEKPDEKVPDDGDNGAITTTDDADEPAAAPAPATAAPVHSEPISWRKRDDDDAVEPSRTQSPPRRRFSPNRRPRRNGKHSIANILLQNLFETKIKLQHISYMVELNSKPY